MHIGFRTSGGRGEYEVVGGHAGQAASGLEGWTFQFLWPDGIVRETGLWLDPGDSGKPRLRSFDEHPFQVGRIITGLLMLPAARREIRATPPSLPVIRKGAFVVTKVGFGPQTTFASPPESVTAVPNYVEIANRAHEDYIDVGRRWRRIDHVLSEASDSTPNLTAPLEEFAAFIKSGVRASPELIAIVEQICRTVDAADSSYVMAEDPLPVLERILGIMPAEGPALPPPDELGEDEADVKLRAAQMYRLARVREYSARRFSIDVREAYGHTCAFCGARWGNIAGVTSGVDAAHILAWGKYDLDVVGNGIALCKNHHWAFDAGLMVPVVEAGNHFIRFTQLADRLDPRSLALLGKDGTRIPNERLPSRPDLRPNPLYLARLYDDLVMAV